MMLGILIKLITLNLSINFAVSIKGMFETFALFILIFLVIAYQSNRIIYKFKLIELFKASSTSEKAKKGSKLLAILSIVFILVGYGVYLSTTNGIDLILGAFVTLFMVVIGTFLFFSSFMFFIIKRQQKNGANYYKGLNMISTSQLLYRIKSNAKMLSVIAILSATTLTAIGVSISVYFMSSQVVEQQAPYSYTLSLDNKEYIKEFEKALADSKDHKLVDKFTLTYIDIDSYKENSHGFKDSYQIMSLSNLNEILKLNGDKELGSINDKEFIHVNSGMIKEYEQSDIDLNNNGKSVSLNRKSSLEKKLFNSFGSGDMIVVSDNEFKNLKENNELQHYYSYNITNQKMEKNSIKKF